MKKSILIIAVLFGGILTANAQTDHGVQFAHKVAQRMKDSLNLTGQQKNDILNINLSLSAQKKAAWQQYGGQSAARYIQRIENTRDSLYKQVLPADKYLLYKQKQSVLVNNN